MTTSKFFIDPNLLSKTSRSLLTRLFEDYRDSLSPGAAALLTMSLTHEEFCAAWAAQFKAADQLGAPLRDALLAIETLSLPENRPLLDDALGHLPPGYEVNRNFPPLNQALHLWIIAQNTPGVTFPVRPAEEQSQAAEHPAVEPRLSANAEREGNPKPESPKAENRSDQPRPTDTNGASTGQDSTLSAEAPGSPIQESINAIIQPSPPPLQSGDSKIENQNSKISSTIDHQLPSELSTCFASLSALSLTDYDHVRHAEAKRLGLRLATLDAEVDRCRERIDETEAEKVFLVVPEPWPEPITDPPALFDAVHDRFLTYVHLPAGGAIVCTTFLGHTHGFSAFHYSPRLNILSNLENSGKSTTAKVIVSMAPKPFRVHNLRPPVVYRVIDKRQPVIVLDEIETYLPLFRELLGLLNAGNSSDACVPRCEGKTVHVYKAFAPVVLVGIGELFRTLRSRSIRIHMTEAPAGVKLTRFDPENVAVEKILARKLARWAADNLEAIAACDPPLPPGARNRLADNWRPLFQIAHVVGGHWPQRVTEAFHALNAANPALHHSSTPSLQFPHQSQIQNQNSKILALHHSSTPSLQFPDQSKIENQNSKISTDSQPSTIDHQLLLADIRSIFTQAATDRLFSRDLVARLIALPDRPWRHLTSSQRKPEKWLANQLRRLGIRPKTLWIGETAAKGYRQHDFQAQPSTINPQPPQNTSAKGYLHDDFLDQPRPQPQQLPNPPASETQLCSSPKTSPGVSESSDMGIGG